MIICDDADIEVAAKGTSWGGFVNTGQVCTSVERVYVYDSVVKRFTEALVEEAKKVKLGDPMDEDTDIGPMASQDQFNNTISKVDLAKKQEDEYLQEVKDPTNLIKAISMSLQYLIT